MKDRPQAVSEAPSPLPSEAVAACDGRTLAVNLLVPLLVLLGLLAIPHDESLRYDRMKADAAKATWVHQRIHHDRRPIDVAFLGSSRTLTGIDGALLQTVLAADGAGAEVANLAVAWEGRNLQYFLARELLERHRPRLLVIEVTESEYHQGHMNFADLADSRDILLAPLVLNLNYLGDLMRLPTRNLKLLARTLAGEGEKIRAAWRARQWPAHFVAAKNVDRSRESLDRTLPDHLAATRNRFLPPQLDWLEFRYPRFYLQKIVDLARDAGVSIAFLHLPHYRTDDPVHDLDRRLNQGSVLTPPTSISDDPANWADLTHLNSRGNTLLTEWLAVQLPELLSPPAADH